MLPCSLVVVVYRGPVARRWRLTYMTLESPTPSLQRTPSASWPHPAMTARMTISAVSIGGIIMVPRTTGAARRDERHAPGGERQAVKHCELVQPVVHLLAHVVRPAALLPLFLEPW